MRDQRGKEAGGGGPGGSNRGKEKIFAIPSGERGEIENAKYRRNQLGGKTWGPSTVQNKEGKKGEDLKKTQKHFSLLIGG